MLAPNSKGGIREVDMFRVEGCKGLLLGAGILLVALPVRAQGNETYAGRITFFMGFVANGRAGAPFSATTKTAFEQTLGDGNRIHNETRGFQARDSSGRTRTETVEQCLIGEDGQPHPQVRVEVDDPATQTDLEWHTGEDAQKVVQVLHRPAPRKMTPEDMAEMQRRMKLDEIRQKSESESRTEEKLGTRNLNGISAEGYRTTQVIPAGAQGNELPLKTTHEAWMSADTGLTLLVIEDDPRQGKSTFEYEDVTLREPDPALFKAPDGYKVVEQHPTPTE
jgi:hypothetical protein